MVTGAARVPRERIGNIDQVALATQRPVVDVRVYAGIDLRIYPNRGLDIGAAWFRGIPLSWISPVGEGGAMDRPDAGQSMRSGSSPRTARFSAVHTITTKVAFP
jgi:hypothetical protein